ncbi:MAG: aminomethyl-transferring glycine dehydrogenase [Bacteroidota bacterium]|jgi:glycine dehydrogenase
MTHPHQFQHRHIGPSAAEQKDMLQAIGVNSVETLISQTVPEGIRLKKPLNIGKPLSEPAFEKHLKGIAAKNKLFTSMIGQGYYNTFVPNVIRRNILENPGWYTAYTPYQAEIAQGRMEAILNFQTLVMDLTGMPVANASLLDEATAAAEAMAMFYANRPKDLIKNGAHVFMVHRDVFPQTKSVLHTRAEAMGIAIQEFEESHEAISSQVFGMYVQYPCARGSVNHFGALTAEAHKHQIQVCVGSDLLALTLLVPPGEWGADAVVGNSQRFGVPMGFGGPHAAFFAVRETYKRLLPGRIIGVSVDAQGNHALRMALQTREQHIRRDKATSNICTAQALLAIMAGMYAVYHGPEGIKMIAGEVHHLACRCALALEKAGYKLYNKQFFDTLCITGVDDAKREEIRRKALQENINLYYDQHSGNIQISFDETHGEEDLVRLGRIFNTEQVQESKSLLHLELSRTSGFMEHPVFHAHRSETSMMRYIKSLENKDLSLTHSMISLGSCTMKLNAAAELYPITWPEFANLHPFVPQDQALGYHHIFEELERDLCEITGFKAMSFQPNSGAQGEYTGLMVIRAYHHSRGDLHRNVALIPSSAHGTNPASAAMAGMKIVVVSCDAQGNVDLADLRSKAEQYSKDLSCLMVTYPSTHGVFEESITEITDIIHLHGGLVYMDGANMNAQVGLTSPGNIGADVCHLNLHKTFAIPHGGGGPGMGPIGVNEKLVPFLPGHPLVKTGGDSAIPAVSAAPWGSALILLISYGYIKMLGGEGLRNATEVAILNANYIKARLQGHYEILYTGKNGHCAHEMILNCVAFKRQCGVEVADIAKRLMDYGFHAPTVAFPVVDTLMVEPTESESKSDLDAFCDAMISIRKEIDEIEKGIFTSADNVLKHAPHTAAMVLSDEWEKPYSRQKAAFPLPSLKTRKFWPSVARVDNAYGDRHLVCSCQPIEAYLEAEGVS